MKWLKLIQTDNTVAFVTIKSISSLQVAGRISESGDRLTRIVLIDGTSLYVGGEHSPTHILEVIKNSRDIDQPFEIIELI